MVDFKGYDDLYDYASWYGEEACVNLLKQHYPTRINGFMVGFSFSEIVTICYLGIKGLDKNTYLYNDDKRLKFLNKVTIHE